MSNVFGRKPTVFFAISIFCTGSILSGVSQSMNMFLGARALTGKLHRLHSVVFAGDDFLIAYGI